LLLLLRILVFRSVRLAVSIGFHTPRSIVKRNASHRHKIEVSFLKRNLVGRAEFELTCVVTHLSIQGVPQLTKEKT
jgi:hypothetical protein